MAISSISSNTTVQPANSQTRANKRNEEDSSNDKSSVVTISAKARILSQSADSNDKKLHQLEVAAAKATREAERKQGLEQQADDRKRINTYA